jgi:hypothetical protein
LAPPERVIVPSALALAAPAAVAVPVVVTGGHAAAHAPLQTDLFGESFTHRYTARPDPSARNVCPDPVAVVITVLPVVPGAAALGLVDAVGGVVLAAGGLVVDPPPAGALELELEPLLHAATRIAIATVPASTAPVLFTEGKPFCTTASRSSSEGTSPRRLSGSRLAITGLLICIVSLCCDPSAAPVTSPIALRLNYGVYRMMDWGGSAVDERGAVS